MKSSWHSISLNEVFKQVDSGRFGLTTDKTVFRLKKFGKNTLPKKKPVSALVIFISQFNSSLVLILFLAVIVSLFLHHTADAVFILIVLLINTSVGFYQEYKANNSLELLRRMVIIHARVIRDGNEKEINSEELVPGDLILIKAGDKVPADARIIESKNLKTNEAPLTGEWLASEKKLGTVKKDTLLGDRSNMVFLGTTVEEGEAHAVVVETGIETQIGEVVSLVDETRERMTPLQKEIARLSRLVGIFVIAISAVILAVGLLKGQSFREISVAAVALAVSAIPAGILPAITIILVLGMRRILKKNAVVRKLIANETLGSVTVICTDKTGTLTEGNMGVSAVLTGTRELLAGKGKGELFDTKNSNGIESHIIALKIAALTNEAYVENPEDKLHEWVIRGRPTDRALLLAGTNAGLDKKELERKYPIIDRINFDSDSKYSATLHQVDKNKRQLFVLGAPELIVKKSVNLYSDGKRHHIQSRISKSLIKKLDQLTKKGLRVVACAFREFNNRSNFSDLNNAVDKLTLVGFIALMDPLRADSKESIAQAKRAGIRTIIVTGDHAGTAKAVAEEIGLSVSDKEILDGTDLDKMDEKVLREKLKDVSILARVSPRDKVRLVEALQKNNEVVAMVGDGINDAPALKAADVGLAVGSGTDVAKEVADVVLLDDSFTTIVKAIEQGRAIFENIRKVFVYLVADDSSQLFLFLLALGFGLPLPLLAAQILWINLVEDGFPDIALTTEQELEGIMEEPPRNPSEPIINKPLKLWTLVIFLVSGLAAFLTFFVIWNLTHDLERSRVIVFALMGLDSLIFAFSARSFKKTIFRKDIFSNYALVLATVGSLLLLMVALYVPFFQSVLSTSAISIVDWLLIFAISMVEIAVIDIWKKRIFLPKMA
jgi:Ca2+-transporting ATPase